ncbi:MAG: uridine kinase, partial [Planctomycetota bacterium]
CLSRRVRRDVLDRGRTVENVLQQYEATVRPMFHQFIEPSKSFADLIIPEGGENERAADVLAMFLASRQ